MCRSCGTLDNETHRLNDCSIYNETNHAIDLVNSNFDHIYSDDNDLLLQIINDIGRVWEFRYANGRMKKCNWKWPFAYLVPIITYLLLSLNYCTLPVQDHLLRCSLFRDLVLIFLTQLDCNEFCNGVNLHLWALNTIQYNRVQFIHQMKAHDFGNSKNYMADCSYPFDFFAD